MKPLLPTADKLVPYLEQIDAARYYSNHGPLLRELEIRLAAHFGVPPSQLALVANGTVALSAALLAVGAKPGKKCLLPAWTYVASAAAVWAANLEPHFVDVSAQTWMLDPQLLRDRIDLDEIGAVMVVSAFGTPVDTQSWDRFAADTGIPVIIDAAGAFDAVATSPFARPGTAPIMISLHATKAFGIGEGGIILSTDENLVHRARQICNFGIWGAPEGQILGYNGKLSEYHAAVGLATLDAWEKRRISLSDVTLHYAARLSPIQGVRTVPGFGTGWVSTYCNVMTQSDSRSIIDSLAAMGVETRRWWHDGVHTQRAYRGFGRDALEVTDLLARRVFGLPFFHDLTDAQIEHVVDCFESAQNS